MSEIAMKLTQTVAPSTTREPMMVRAMNAAGRALCGLRGHDLLMTFEGKRMQMRCSGCGFISPGWSVDGRMPKRRFAGDATRHTLVKKAK